MLNYALTKDIGKWIKSIHFWQLFGWALTVTLSVYLWSSADTGLESKGLDFLCLIAIAVVMWVFNLTPIVVPALFVLLSTILLDIAPREIVLSGFTSDVFFMVLGIFILSALVSSSGLMYWGALKVLYWLPPSRFLGNLILFFTGNLLTLVIPSPLGRSAILSPLIFKLAGNNTKSGEVNPNLTSLLISNLHGTTLLSTVFLTGNPLNFIMLGFFNPQTQYRFQWVNWLQANLILFVVLFSGYLVFIFRMFRKGGLNSLPKSNIESLLQKSSSSEKNSKIGSLLAILVFGIGILTVKYHQIELVWLAFGIAVILSLFGSLSLNQLKPEDWSILLFIASIVAWGGIMEHLQLDSQIAERVQFLGNILESNLYLGLAVLIGVVLLIRVFFPGGPTFVILMGALVPLSVNLGISPWVIGIIALTISEGFFLPYQHGVYSQIMGKLQEQNLAESIDIKKVYFANFYFVALKIIALYASLPYWKYLAIL